MKHWLFYKLQFQNSYCERFLINKDLTHKRNWRPYLLIYKTFRVAHKQAAFKHNEKPEAIFVKQHSRNQGMEINEKTTKFHGDFHVHEWNGIKFLQLYSPYISISKNSLC